MKSKTNEVDAQGAENQEPKGRSKAASASYTLRATWENIVKLHGLGLWDDEDKATLTELHRKAVERWVTSFQS